MKRTIVVLLVLAGLTPVAEAAKRVTAAQFEQAVASLHGKSDTETAFLVADMQLTERLSQPRLARLTATLPGERSRQALTAVADASEFQPPPPEEIPASAAPDLAGQKRIMGLVAAYVSKAVPQLPNFIATRATDFFEDTPLLVEPAASIPYQPLHLVGHSSTTVVYRDGHEVEEPKSKRARKLEGPRGLQSWGEFGPILATILVDAANSRLAFSRWEAGSSGLQAVFTYEVPKRKSHYDVNYCCVAKEAGTDVADTSPFHEFVGYHGDMAVDPETSSILRLSVVAALNNDSPVTRADILVDYGPVVIGGKTYICPVKSVSVTTAQIVQLAPGGYPLARQLQPLKTMLNHVTFENYHVFRSESRVLAAENDAGSGATGSEAGKAAPESRAAASEPDNALAADRQNASTATSRTETTAAANTTAAPAANADAAITQATVAMPASAEPEQPEFTFRDTADMQSAPAQSGPVAASSGFRLRTTTKLVDVGLVAYDKKGQPVTDLKQSDFEIYDNGSKQEIKYFAQAGQLAPITATQTTQAAGAPTETVYSNRQTDSALQPHTTGVESHVTVLLVDSSSLAWADLQYARQEILRFLKTSPTDEPIGLYVLRNAGFQILLEPTIDHELLANTLSRWMPDALELARAQREEERHREHLDTVHNIDDLTKVNGNESPDPSTYSSGQGVAQAMAHPTDARLRPLGTNLERDSLPNLLNVGRHLAAIPGHKSLIWIASDNVLADWSNQSVAKPDEQAPSFLHSAALRVQETLNEAHVSIFPLDASQLEPGGIGADLSRVNIVPFDQSDRSQAQATIGDAAPANKPGRIAAQIKQDTHPIQPEFRELSEATGGRALRRAADIAGELNGIAEDGRAAYLLSFAPDGPADDKYHLITVKLTGRRNLTLRYRTGYLYETEPATAKERFHRAVWQPRDLNEIALTATPSGPASERSLKLNIAATDLEMAQAGNRWTDKLDIFLIERNDMAFRAKFNERTLGLRLLPATYQKALREGILIDQPLPAKSEAGTFRIIVVDENSGRMGTVTVPRAIP